MFKRLSSLVLISALLLSFAAVAPPAQASDPVAQNVPGQYIVVFHASVADPAAAASDLARGHGLGLSRVFGHALKGFAATIPAARLAAIQADPRVAYVEADRVWSIEAQEVPTGLRRSFASSNAELDIDGTDDFRVDVDVAVLDTGVDFQHPDLNVNVAGSVNCAQGGPFGQACGAGGDDDHYHGTHVAGTIGALDNDTGVAGVAPGARIWAVKVLNSKGSGYTSWIVAGIDYVAAHASEIEVANMSLGGAGTSQAYNQAIAAAVAQGVVFVVAAGNSASDAGGFTPANAPDVITVSALADFDGLAGGLGGQTCRADQDDTLADFSNFGATIEIAAPGVCILSTYPIERGSYGTISGTSMASPHVAGAAALLASVNNPSSSADVSSIRNTLISTGNSNWTDDSGDGTKEPLLDVSNAAIYNPTLVAGPGGGGGGGGGGGEESISLAVTAYKVKGVRHADLAWGGATTNVDIYRNGIVIAAASANDGAYTDNLGLKGGGSAIYQVCEAGTTTCSATVTVTW